LAKNDINGTFFVIGSQLRAYPDLWRQALAAGHEICNHTYDHQYLVTLSAEQIKEELVQWEEAAREVLGEEYVSRMKREFAYLRFPGGSGHNDEKVLKAVAEAGYWPIAWSAETYAAVLKNHDLESDPVAPIAQEVSDHIVGSSWNGTIILFHFSSWDTLYLDSTIKGLVNKGLRPTTVSEVLEGNDLTK
jgi:peptidoglycan/xylan/chitin deacetylase (PgdA/CDA1 family)